MYLNCKTYYSFRYGTFSTAELVETAAHNGVNATVLRGVNIAHTYGDIKSLNLEYGLTYSIQSLLSFLLFFFLFQNIQWCSFFGAFINTYRNEIPVCVCNTLLPPERLITGLISADRTVLPNLNSIPPIPEIPNTLALPFTLPTVA